MALLRRTAPLTGGRFNRVLHDPDVKYREGLTKEQYTDTKAKQTTMNHFPGSALCIFAPYFHPLETSPIASLDRRRSRFAQNDGAHSSHGLLHGDVSPTHVDTSVSLTRTCVK